MWDLKAMSQRLHRMLYHDLQVPMRPELEGDSVVESSCGNYMYVSAPASRKAGTEERQCAVECQTTDKSHSLQLNSCGDAG